MRFGFAILAALVIGLAWVWWDGGDGASSDSASAPRSTVDAKRADENAAPAFIAAEPRRSEVEQTPRLDPDFWDSLPPTSLRGRVVDLAGTPLPGATVTVTQSGSNDATTLVTDASGAYALPEIRGIDAILTARHDGYVATGLGLRALFLVEQSEHPVPDLVLARPVTLHGHVQDDAGAPIAGAVVDVDVSSRVFDGEAWRSPDHLARTTRTDARGRFTFELPPEPTWTLTTFDAGAMVESEVALDEFATDVAVVLPVLRPVTLSVVAAADGTPIETFTASASFHGDRALLDSALLCTAPTTELQRSIVLRPRGPGVVEFDARIDAAVDLGVSSPGFAFCDLPRLSPPEARVVARMVTMETRPIRARVIAGDGTPISGLGVSLYSRAVGGCDLDADPHGMQVAQRVTNDLGEVEFDARSDGPFQVMVEHEPYPAARTDWFPWSADTADTTREIRIEAPARIRGRLRLGGAELPASMALTITRDDGWLGFTTSNRDGGYVTPALAPGSYSVARDREAREGDPPPTVAVVAGQEASLDVELSAIGLGALMGTVRIDGVAVPGINVGVPLAGDATTDAAGRYTVAGIPVGPTICEFRRGYSHAAVRAVTIEAGTVTRLDVDLKLASVRGRVLDGATKAPIVEAMVSLRPADAHGIVGEAWRFEPFSADVETGPDGTWSVAAIECRDYVLSIEPLDDSAYAATQQLVRVERNAREIVTVLEAPAAVHLEDCRDGDGILVARRLDTPWREAREGYASDDGSITIDALDAGAWEIALWSEREGVRQLVHDFGTLSFAAGETKTLQAPR
jgi:protocatechuate 3,4-dioxygenase beta subunit